MSRVTRIVSPHAAPMRQAMPEAEARLWHQLRDRRLMGHKFRRQHSSGPFVADFACVEARLVIELDGSQHARAEDADGRRTAFLAAEGWTVIRFWNDRVLTDIDNVLREIIAKLPQEKPPLPQAGEGHCAGAACRCGYCSAQYRQPQATGGRMTTAFEVSLAPQQLWQAINPWSFYNQGAQFGLINVNLGRTSAPATERAILDEVGSYGRQLGWIGDALEVLIAHVALDGLSRDEKDAIAMLQGQLAAVRKIKRREAAD